MVLNVNSNITLNEDDLVLGLFIIVILMFVIYFADNNSRSIQY